MDVLGTELDADVPYVSPPALWQSDEITGIGKELWPGRLAIGQPDQVQRRWDGYGKDQSEAVTRAENP